MNYTINNLPERTVKPRQYGYTMAMDKGMSIRETEDFLSICADHVDIVKLGWATSYVTPNLGEKIKVYQQANIPCYFGGTLFEAFLIRNQFDENKKIRIPMRENSRSLNLSNAAAILLYEAWRQNGFTGGA